MARARPDQGVREAPRRRGRARGGRSRADGQGGDREGRRGTALRRRESPFPDLDSCTTTSTCSPTRSPPGGPSMSARPRCTAASASARPADPRARREGRCLRRRRRRDARRRQDQDEEGEQQGPGDEEEADAEEAEARRRRSRAGAEAETSGDDAEDEDGEESAGGRPSVAELGEAGRTRPRRKLCRGLRHRRARGRRARRDRGGG